MSRKRGKIELMADTLQTINNGERNVTNIAGLTKQNYERAKKIVDILEDYSLVVVDKKGEYALSSKGEKFLEYWRELISLMPEYESKTPYKFKRR